MDSVESLEHVVPPEGLQGMKTPSFPNIDKGKFYILKNRYTPVTPPYHYIIEIVTKTDTELGFKSRSEWDEDSWQRYDDDEPIELITPQSMQSGQYKLYEPASGGKRKKTRRTRKSKKTRKHVSKRR